MQFNTNYSNFYQLIENTIYINYYYFIFIFLYIISNDILKAMDYFTFKLILIMIRLYYKKINEITKSLMEITKTLIRITKILEVVESVELKEKIFYKIKKLSDDNIIEFKKITKLKANYLALKEPIYNYINNSNDRQKSLLVVRKINNLFKRIDDACYFVEQNSDMIIEII